MQKGSFRRCGICCKRDRVMGVHSAGEVWSTIALLVMTYSANNQLLVRCNNKVLPYVKKITQNAWQLQ